MRDHFIIPCARRVFVRAAISISCCAAVFFCVAQAGEGESDFDRDNTAERLRLKEGWKKLSEEERNELHNQMRAAWQQRLSPEEQHRLRECREKYDKRQDRGNKNRDDNRDGNRIGRDDSMNRKDKVGDKGRDGKEGDTRYCFLQGDKAHWHRLTPEEREIFREKLREALRRKDKASERETPMVDISRPY